MSTIPVGAPTPGRVHDGDSSSEHGHGDLCDATQTAASKDQTECAKQPPPVFLHSPPDSNNAAKTDESDSELSDLEDEPNLDDAPRPLVEPQSQDEPELEQLEAQPEPQPEPQPEEELEDDIGEVLPDHWSGAVPIFKPTMDQFKDFKRFMEKVDSYGMKSGIIKIIPPQEWRDSQPPLDNLVKQIKVREPIKQDIMGSNGTYRQVNILHGRSYNVPQWRHLCEQSEHQPPARRGERRANAPKAANRTRAPAAPKSSNPSTPKKRGKGTAKRAKGKQSQIVKEEEERPMTPVSPKPEIKDEAVDEAGDVADDQDDQPRAGRMGGSRQAKPKTQSTSARRKFSRREGSAMIDEAAFKDFDYRMDISEYTPERCEELERVYWKTLTYASPLYGADLMGTLFDDTTETWNLSKLPNLLDVLGTKVPGVNTAYLYLGMWKATFAWHLEDVDLYSINYLHFGAPKQWYSISQADARKFEAAMKSIWPADAKACSQFLRHKAFLISPQNLLSNFGIKVNKVVSYPGEFVVTYPYGYHSGYNLGYNCAEAVNFALDSWLEMGKIAKKCECAQAQDSVWINVYEVERKLRGEETEYEVTEDEEDYDEDVDMTGLPTPPANGVRFKGLKRKRGHTGDGQVKKIRLRLRTTAEPPCCLCPNDIPGMEILPTDDGNKAHRLCAIYLPETYIDMVDGKEIVSNVARIHKDRLSLKCLFCRSKRGACFQCSQKKCARPYHATCAAAAGVFIEEQDVPVFSEDGTEYKEQAFEFSCRYHRTKRDKKLDGDALEADSRILESAVALKTGEVCQLQYYKGEIFAGLVVENRTEEQTLLLDIIPNGDRIEVEWKWLLLADPADYHLPKASANAIPMPASQKAKEKLNAKRPEDEQPRKDDAFGEGLTWAEFHSHEAANQDQVKVDLAKENQLWYYLGKTSTEARAQYTDALSKPIHNPRSNYLDTIPRPPKPALTKVRPPAQRQPIPAPIYRNSYMGMGPMSMTGSPAISPAISPGAGRSERPYVYKPRKPIDASFDASRMYTSQRFTPTPSATASPQMSYFPQQQHQQQIPGQQSSGTHSTQRFEVMHGQTQWQYSQGSPSPNPNLPMQRPSPTPAPGNSPMPYAPSPSHQRPLSATKPTPRPVQHRQPSCQVYQSAYQKYAFFQVHHNRDSGKYRTPYAIGGGFTNGYQGDLRAYLMTNQNALLRRASTSMSPMCPPVQARGSPHTYQSVYSTPSAPPSISNPQGMPAAQSPMQPQTSMSPAASSGDSGQPQSTVRSHEMPLSHFQQSAQHKPLTTPAPKVYPIGQPAAVSLSLKSTKSATQVPVKQSPVPLPANFLAAMTSTPSNAASGKSPPLLSSGQQATSTSPQPSLPATSLPVEKTAEKSAENPADKPAEIPTVTPKSTHSLKVSTTPVPIPFIPHVASQQTTSASGQPQPISTNGVSLEASTSVASQQDVDSKVASEQIAQADAVREGANELQEFPDVPGCESMEFVDRMMRNLRRVSFQGETD